MSKESYCVSVDRDFTDPRLRIGRLAWTKIKSIHSFLWEG